MSTDTNGSHPASVVAIEAPAAEVGRAATAAPETVPPAEATYADITTAPELRPVIPEHLRTWAGISTEMGLHARRHWHRTKYHGIRAPWYAIKTVTFAVLGAGYLLGMLVAWWHWLDGKVLESQGVAAGRPGYAEAMKAHTQGLKTRAARGRILVVCLALAAGAVLAMVVYFPWWGWALFAIAGVLFLARYGRPDGKPIIGAALIAPQYQQPTPEVITRALASLGIAAINSALKDNGKLVFISDPHRDGPGWATQLDLPHGVTVTQIIAKREELASGLRRPLSATWPAKVESEHAGRLDLWVGFHDISKTKPVPWPLARAGQVDVFAGFPFGTNPRQQPIDAPLFEHNWLIGAQPGQGKTAAVRVVASAAALDPMAELWVHELAGKGDLEPYAQVSHRYVSGLDDDSIAYAAESMRKLRAELDTRSKKMKGIPKEQRPDGKITPDMARKRSQRLFPLVAIFDEVQNLFMHPGLGEQAQEDAAYVIRLGRAYGVILVLATQRPDSKSLPTAVSGNVSARFCLKVPGQMENDMILGTSSYKNGYNAAAFRSKTDAGLGWLKSEGDPQIVRTYYIDLRAAERIAKRARAMREQAGTLSGYALGLDDDDAVRSFAADVLSVFASDRNLWCETIATRLAASIPGTYASITQAAVSDQLRKQGVEVKPVREAGAGTRAGCERSAVEQAAGVMAGA